MRYIVTEQGRWPSEFSYPARYVLWITLSILVFVSSLIMITVDTITETAWAILVLLIFFSIVSMGFSSIFLLKLKLEHEEHNNILKSMVDGPKSLQEIDAKFKPDTTDWTRTMLNELIVKGLVTPVNNG